MTIINGLMSGSVGDFCYIRAQSITYTSLNRLHAKMLKKISVWLTFIANLYLLFGEIQTYVA
jgi:hypothetical protein